MKRTHTSIILRLLLILGLGLMFTLTSLEAQPVDNERSQANPNTGNKWFHRKSITTIQGYANDGYRLIDIQVVDKSPYRFSGAMVRNTGVHQKEWGWFVGLTSPQVQDTAAKYDLRAIDIEVYRAGSQKRLAVVFVKNTGSQAVDWSYYTDRTLDYLIDKAEETGSRIIDLDSYTVSGKRYYSGVMIRNTGKNYKEWWVRNNRTGAQLLADAGQFNAKIIDLERKSNNNYVAILEKSSHPDFKDQFVLWRGEKSENITEVARHYGARIIDIEPYVRNGKRRFDLLMLDNVNPLTTRIGNILRNNTDGDIAPYHDNENKRGYTVGFRLEEVGGGTRASLQPDRKFYPASTIKVLQYWYIHRTLLHNNPNPVNTLNNGTWRVCQATNCDNVSNLNAGCNTQRPLRNIMRRMMINSDNEDTNALQDYAGNGNAALGRNLMNTWARNILGLSTRTELKHKLNCDNVENDKPNIATVRDFNRLYEGVFSDNNALDPNLENLFIANMLNQNGNMFTNQITAVINDEGAKLGLSNTEIANFTNAVRFVHKNGNINTAFLSGAGWIELPYYCGLSQKQFVFSMFWDNAATTDKQNTGSNLSIRFVMAELLRDEIRAAMASCRTFGLALNFGTMQPVPGVSVSLEMENSAGGFDPVRPASANMSPTQNPMTTSRDGSFGWQIFQRGTYRVKATAPGFQVSYSSTFRMRNNGKPPKKVEVLMKPACPAAFVVNTCPDQSIAPHYPGRRIAQLKATASGGQLPYSYQWSTGVQGPEALADPLEQCCSTVTINDSLPPKPEEMRPGSATYTVTATDANGCQATATHTVHVLDISCRLATGEPAVEMCDQRTTAYVTQCVPLDEVALKLSSGDWMLGNCNDGVDFSGGSCGNPQGLPRPTAFKQATATIQEATPMQVYPNPFGQKATVAFELPTAMAINLEVYDLAGKRMHVVMSAASLQAGSHQESIDTHHLPSGMYVVILRGEGGFTQKTKVIKTQ